MHGRRRSRAEFGLVYFRPIKYKCPIRTHWTLDWLIYTLYKLCINFWFPVNPVNINSFLMWFCFVDKTVMILETQKMLVFSWVALAKAGLVVGPLRLSVRSFVPMFVLMSVRLCATLLGCLVCVICNSNSFYSLIFKLCLMIVHTLKKCTSYFVHTW